jgi:hypothetical protein
MSELMEYLVTRDEPVSRVRMPNGFEYDFKPNKHGVKVCNVPSDGSVKLMLESGNFRRYKEPKAEALMKTAEERQKIIDQATVDGAEGNPTVVIKPEHATRGLDELFINGWIRLNKDRFETHVTQNLDRFNAASDETLEKAVQKWAKVHDGSTEGWPGRFPATEPKGEPEQ